MRLTIFGVDGTKRTRVGLAELEALSWSLTRIAKALASGATVTDIAEAEGIGRTLASREANSPECRQLIAEFVGDEWEEMRAVFYRSMRAIEHALSARREYLTKDGRRSCRVARTTMRVSLRRSTFVTS